MAPRFFMNNIVVLTYLCGVALISLLVSTLHVEDEPKKEYTIKWKIVFVLDNNWLSVN